MDTISIDQMPQELQLGSSKFAFLGVQCCTCSFNAFKYCGESLVVLRLIFAEDEGVVHLAENSL